MNNPTLQELMEYLDGTLHPMRYREIETMIKNSPSLQKEIALLKAVKRSVSNDIVASPSKKFTSRVMKEILPVQQESFWFRILKNSSNIFAMVLVLSLIGIVLVSSPSNSAHSAESSTIMKSIESYTNSYNSVVETISSWSKQYIHPVNQAVKTPSGKFFFIGLFAFVIFMIVDEFFGKRYFHTQMRN